MLPRPDRPVNIAGISHTVHGSAAALVRDREVVAGALEERFDRRKFSAVFPQRALDFVTRYGRVGLEDIDAFAYFMSSANFVQALNRPFSERLRFYPEAYFSFPNYVLPAVHDPDYQYVEQSFVTGGRRRRFYYIDHHTAHAAQAFFASPFDEAAILTLDGRGDGVCGSLGIGRGKHIEQLVRIPFPHSIGQFYSTFTEFIGFTPNSDEYKLMGLAAYGDPTRLYDAVRRLLVTHDDGTFELDLTYFAFYQPGPKKFNSKFVEAFGEPRRSDEDPYGRFADIAAACQKVTEESVLDLLRALYRRTGLRDLCYGGGVALNSLANGRILRETPFERVYIPADPADSGVAIGAALYATCEINGEERPRPLLQDYLGPGYDDDHVNEFLASNNIKARRVEDPSAAAAELVAAGKVVGWMQGRLEFGPRALGDRSILADPRRAEMKHVVNTKVKFREPYRPFAPSVSVEAVDRYFEAHPSLSAPGSPTDFMIYVLPVREEQRESIPAVTHQDGTGRVQTVRRETNPRYWDLLRAFEQITGHPVVLNTSFNVKDEPIVLSPADAVRCFFSSGLDHLILGDQVIDK